jgi:NAD(P)-dependent dehydrogenase (short-subunit alcohol dehydrogenase family)
VNLLASKRILVTGGTSGIGRAIVELCAASGADVAFCGLDASTSDEVTAVVAEHGRLAYFESVDLSDLDAARSFTIRAAEALGGLNGVVNNAGADFNLGVLGATLDSIDLCLRTLFYAPWAICQESYPYLRRMNRATIVNISSIHSHQTVPSAFPYNAAKAALEALTTSIALEWANDNILSIAVAPGWIDTPLVQAAFESSGDAAGERRHVTEHQLLGRMGSAEDIASLVCYLLSDLNGFLTGSTVVVDGGMHRLLQPF